MRLLRALTDDSGSLTVPLPGPRTPPETVWVPAITEGPKGGILFGAAVAVLIVGASIAACSALSSPMIQKGMVVAGAALAFLAVSGGVGFWPSEKTPKPLNVSREGEFSTWSGERMFPTRDEALEDAEERGFCEPFTACDTGQALRYEWSDVPAEAKQPRPRELSEPDELRVNSAVSRAYGLTPVIPDQKVPLSTSDLWGEAPRQVLVTRAGQPGTWRCVAMIKNPVTPPLTEPSKITVQRVLCSPTGSDRIEVVPKVTGTPGAGAAREARRG